MVKTVYTNFSRSIFDEGGQFIVRYKLDDFFPTVDVDSLAKRVDDLNRTYEQSTPDERLCVVYHPKTKTIEFYCFGLPKVITSENTQKICHDIEQIVFYNVDYNMTARFVTNDIKNETTPQL